MFRSNAQEPTLNLRRGASLRESTARAFAPRGSGHPHQHISGPLNGPVKDSGIDTIPTLGPLCLPTSQVCDGGTKHPSQILNRICTVYPHRKGQYRVIF